VYDRPPGEVQRGEPPAQRGIEQASLAQTMCAIGA